ncbi:histone H1B-like [Rissa tridactyla]|uniref:histone H1B-like n=1 Tax=Rissa tridactyla TaxID=75485 RepID=UPI0023BAD856|nr:histone H1B-like [Rissa tridactyla]
MPRRKAAAQPSTSLPQKRGRASLSDLILYAVYLAAGRKGASLAFIKKVLVVDGYNVVRNGARLKAALGSLLDKGLLQRVTGSGIAGSFRLGRVGKERVERAGPRGRAAGIARRSPAGKAKGRRRVVKATVQRLKKPRRPRGKAEVAAGGAEEAGGPAAVVVVAGEC